MGRDKLCAADTRKVFHCMRNELFNNSDYYEEVQKLDIYQ